MKKFFFTIFFMVVLTVGIYLLVFHEGNSDKIYLVGYKEGASAEEITTIIEKNNGIILTHYENIKVFKVKFKKENVKSLVKENGVRYVEEDIKVESK